MAAERVKLTYDDLTEVYETLNAVGQFLKRFEQATAALDLRPKPDPYSPLAERVMATQRKLGEEVGRIHNARQQPASVARKDQNAAT